MCSSPILFIEFEMDNSVKQLMFVTYNRQQTFVYSLYSNKLHSYTADVYEKDMDNVT